MLSLLGRLGQGEFRTGGETGCATGRWPPQTALRPQIAVRLGNVCRNVEGDGGMLISRPPCAGDDTNHHSRGPMLSLWSTLPVSSQPRRTSMPAEALEAGPDRLVE